MGCSSLYQGIVSSSSSSSLLEIPSVFKIA